MGAGLTFEPPPEADHPALAVYMAEVKAAGTYQVSYWLSGAGVATPGDVAMFLTCDKTPGPHVPNLIPIVPGQCSLTADYLDGDLLLTDFGGPGPIVFMIYQGDAVELEAGYYEMRLCVQNAPEGLQRDSMQFTKAAAAAAV
ncbi:hypothetical protein JKP88DRAFT_248385 [Tribonema minus]|uniref:Uncharacterized protein n=1 Tax=Tribonema minus TaxID=303371 RepID=A0A835YMR9_9STRA|nr:hypothetical protein JKP88DRAFT_248385 [Tribonema minus]